MNTIRKATIDDAALIAGHRQRMFGDAGFAEQPAMAAMTTNFLAWVRPRFADGTYLGWLAEHQGQVVAGAGVWLMDFPPHFLDAEPVRAYLLNFYTEPAHRGHGLASELLRASLAEVARRGIRVATLPASPFGKPIYEKHGFTATNEMMLQQQ